MLHYSKAAELSSFYLLLLKTFVECWMHFRYKLHSLIKFIYSKKTANFCEISTVDLSYVATVKFTVEISQDFGAFSEYMNFMPNRLLGMLRFSGIPEAEIFGQKRRFSAFGLRFRPPNLKAEYGRMSNFRFFFSKWTLSRYF